MSAPATATRPRSVEEAAAMVEAARLPAVTDVVGAELVPADRPITGGEIDMLFRLAKGLALSGMFKDIRQAEQAFAKLIFGRDLGLSATQAMTDIFIVEGKPEMSANLQAAKVKASGRYDYRVLQLDNDQCRIEFGPAPAPMRSEDGEWLPWPGAFGISEFGQEDVKLAGLAGKDNHKKYPRNMLFARAMSNGTAWFVPDVMNGIRVYAEGEVQQAIATVTARASEPEPPDAEVVDDGLITAEQLATVKAALAAAEVDEQAELMLLGSVGVESLDELTPELLAEFQQAVANRTVEGRS